MVVFAECPTCEGIGQVRVEAYQAGPTSHVWSTCGSCLGSGRLQLQWGTQEGAGCGPGPRRE